MKYSSWLDSWLANKKVKVKPATYASYSLMIHKHLIPVLGDFEVTDITEDILQQTIILWATEGNRKTEKALSRKTIKELIQLSKQTIKAYCKAKKVATPSFDDLYFPAVSTRPQEIFTSQEQEQIIKGLFSNPTNKKVGIALGLLAGMRIGEVCALKWEDVDFVNRRIYVANTLQRVFFSSPSGEGKSELLFGSPKSQDSSRFIPVSSTLYYLLKLIQPVEATDFYILSNQAKPIEPTSLRNFYYRFLKKINVRRLTFHSLRHTFGTKAITCKLDAATVCKIMGHSSPAVTLKLYCHPQFEDLQRAMDELDTKWL